MGNTLEATVYTPTDAVYTPFFDYQCDAFGLVVLGSGALNTEKVKYVCSIASEYLDNDEDGVVDDERMPNLMKEGALLLFAT